MNKLEKEELLVKEVHEKSICYNCKQFGIECPILTNLLNFNKKFNIGTSVWECETFEHA